MNTLYLAHSQPTSVRGTDVPHAIVTGSYVFRRARGGDGPKQKTLTPAPTSAYATKDHANTNSTEGLGLASEQLVTSQQTQGKGEWGDPQPNFHTSLRWDCGP